MGDDRQEISAQDLHELCLEDRRSTRELSFDKARITGPVQFAGVLIDRLLRFTDCEFADPIDLTGARVSAGIYLVGCKIHSLEADRITVQGDLVLEHVNSGGLVSLSGARITGHLCCTGSEFLPTAGKAFNGDGMAVGGSALFDGGFRSTGELNLASARIDGSVDMTGATLSNNDGIALMADGIRVGAGMLLCANSGVAFNAAGTILLAEARVSGKVKCSGGHFCTPAQGTAIDAQRIEADEVRLDEGFEAAGLVCLDGGNVKGRVTCENGRFCNPGRIALSANGLNCIDMRLGHGFTATGKVQLMGARISHELNCTAGTFDNENGTALIADGLICDGAVYFNDNFQASGRVKLLNARIKTELNCTKGVFTRLRAGGMICDGNVYLNNGFAAPDGVELIDATVGRDLNCHNGDFGKFRAQRLTVGAKFDWLPAKAPESVDLSFANVGLLQDDPDKSWPRPDEKDGSKTELAGFTFLDLDEKLPNAHKAEDLTKRRITWLDMASYAPRMYQQLTRIYRRKGRDREAKKDAHKAEELTKRRITWLEGASYAPGIYQQLARIYRRKGWDREAKKIAIAGQRDRRKRGGMPRAARAWSRFLDVSVRYGYEIHRPLKVVVVAWIVGTVFFYFAQANGLMEAVSPPQGAPVDANTCTSAYPCFFPFAYAFEIFLPVINLRQVSFWLPAGNSPLGMALLMWVWIAIVSGWLITVAVAAGIGHLFSQQD